MPACLRLKYPGSASIRDRRASRGGRRNSMCSHPWNPGHLDRRWLASTLHWATLTNSAKITTTMAAELLDDRSWHRITPAKNQYFRRLGPVHLPTKASQLTPSTVY